MPYKDINKKREQGRLYYWLNRDKILANKDARNKTRRNYYKANKKAMCSYHKEWRDRDGNKDKQRERHTKYYNGRKKELADKSHIFYLSHPTRKMKDMEAKMKIKVDVLTHYGNGKCTCVRCGFDDIRALSIDHINGGGCIERRKTAMGGSSYRRLQKNNYPEGYQTLCMNCQFIKKIENNENKWRNKSTPS